MRILALAFVRKFVWLRVCAQLCNTHVLRGVLLKANPLESAALPPTAGRRICAVPLSFKTGVFGRLLIVLDGAVADVGGLQTSLSSANTYKDTFFLPVYSLCIDTRGCPWEAADASRDG